MGRFRVVHLDDGEAIRGPGTLVLVDRDPARAREVAEEGREAHPGAAGVTVSRGPFSNGGGSR